MAAHLNITAVARRTGIPADTLRKWEQRYGVLRPTRSEGGHRRYSDVDVGRVQWLKARLGEGYRIGEAAELLGSGSVEAPRTPARLRDALYDAVLRTDLPAIQTLLEQAFTVDNVSQTLTKVVAPLLARTGAAWEAGELSVAQEHLLSAEVRARLEPLLGSASSGVRGTAVLACAPGERHELGLMMLGVLLHADGWRMIFLGADTPVSAAAAIAKSVDASAVCLSAAMHERVVRLRYELRATPLPKQATLVVGGRAVDRRTARSLGAHELSADLQRAVTDIRRLAR